MYDLKQRMYDNQLSICSVNVNLYDVFSDSVLNMKRLMILGASEFQIPLIESARRRGIQTCVLDINPQAPARYLSDEFHVCSIRDYNKVLGIAEQYMPDGITAGMCDVAVLTVARICERLNLPGLDVETAIKATDKYAMIKAFSSNNVPCPGFKLLNRSDNFDEFEVPWLPFIVKPVDMAGSRGINLVKDVNEKSALIKDSISASDSGNVIFEEYLVGPEVSVEMVVINHHPIVLQITEKITSGAPHFVEMGHIQPARLSNETRKSIVNVAESAVRSIGLKNSIVHAEIIITDSGPKMVELGARMGGDGIQQQLIKLSAGIDLPSFAVDLALGLPLNVPIPTTKKYSMIRFIPSIAGEIRSIEINIQMNQVEGLIGYKLFCKCGDVFEEKNDNSGRFGYVLAQGDSYEDVVNSCKESIDYIRINVKN